MMSEKTSGFGALEMQQSRAEHGWTCQTQFLYHSLALLSLPG
jgi:hypothetical protein